MTFRNRIISYGVKPADQFLANPKNPRLHPQYQREVMKAALTSVGFVAPVVEAKSGYLLDGHERIWQALQNNNADVPFVVVDVDESEADYVLATFDPITNLATYDAQLLDELLREVNSDSAAVQQMLSELAESAGLYPNADEPSADSGAQVDRAEELQAKWQVAPGDLWVIGKHRLLCGDSTNAADVARVMGDDKPLLMVTDPPYGVEYDPHWRDSVVGEFGQIAARGGAVTNDDIVDWSTAWGLFTGDIVYCWHAGRYAGEVQQSFENSGFEIRSQIIWVKQHFALSRGHYHWMHEPCWYAVRRNQSANFIGDRTQTTVWEIASLNPAGRQEERVAHGTQKPIECMARPIRNHDAPIVYDPFGGSGTTMVACEQLTRQCRMIEISEKYCSVILERMAGMGLEPRREHEQTRAQE